MNNKNIRGILLINALLIIDILKNNYGSNF